MRKIFSILIIVLLVTALFIWFAEHEAMLASVLFVGLALACKPNTSKMIVAHFFVMDGIVSFTENEIYNPEEIILFTGNIFQALTFITKEKLQVKTIYH
jgi:hypothetical protein